MYVHVCVHVCVYFKAHEGGLDAADPAALKAHLGPVCIVCICVHVHVCACLRVTFKARGGGLDTAQHAVRQAQLGPVCMHACVYVCV